MDGKKFLDVCISWLLAWIGENFPVGQLEIKYLPGDCNQIGDTKSRWNTDQPNVVESQEDSTVKQEKRKVASLELEEDAQSISSKVAVEVDSMTIWEQAHGGYVGYKTIMYRNTKWGLNLTAKFVRKQLKARRLCQKNRTCVRNTSLGTLNDTEYTGEVLGAFFWTNQSGIPPREG